jgi:hypothetical protein
VLHAYLFILAVFVITVAGCFIPKRLYSVYEVLSDQYGSRVALWVIGIVALLFAGGAALYEISFHAGW